MIVDTWVNKDIIEEYVTPILDMGYNCPINYGYSTNGVFYPRLHTSNASQIFGRSYQINIIDKENCYNTDYVLCDYKLENEISRMIQRLSEIYNVYWNRIHQNGKFWRQYTICVKDDEYIKKVRMILSDVLGYDYVDQLSYNSENWQNTIFTTPFRVGKTFLNRSVLLKYTDSVYLCDINRNIGLNFSRLHKKYYK